MWLVGAKPWRTTATCSKTSPWVELTTVDMLTFLHGLPSLRWQASLLLFYSVCLFMIFMKVQAVIGKSKKLEGYRAGLHTDSFWHFPPLLNGTWSSGVLLECLHLQSYFNLWVINHFKSHVLLTFHLSQHTRKKWQILCGIRQRSPSPGPWTSTGPWVLWYRAAHKE